MGSLFGKPATESSSNRAYGDISSGFKPLFGLAGQGSNALSALLGGDPNAGFNQYKKATGFDWQGEQGSRGITGNAAAAGMLRSGSTQKALVNYGNNQQNQYANDYMTHLLQQAGLGFNAGQLVSGAGNTQSSTGQKPGLGGILGSLAGNVAISDRKAKKNIFQVGKLPSGLNLYQFRYKKDDGRTINRTADVSDQLESLGSNKFLLRKCHADEPLATQARDP